MRKALLATATLGVLSLGSLAVFGSGGAGGLANLASSGSVTGILPIGNGGTSGSTAGSGFANLSPQTTKGDLISYSTSPQRVAVGTTGQLLQSDSTAGSGVSWTSSILGTTTNNSAATGYVGEIVSSVVASTGATLLTNNVAKNITSISLTAGDWDVASVGCVTAGTGGTVTGTVYTTGISATSGTRGTIGDSELGTSVMPTTSSSECLSVPDVRMSLSATTNIYMVSLALYSGGAVSAYGRLSARRRR